MTFYKDPIATVGLSRTVSEINVDFSPKSQFFSDPEYLTSPADGIPLKLGNLARAQKH